MKHTRKKSNGMKRHMLLLPVFLVAVVALILGATAPVSWGFGGWGEFADAEIFFEYDYWKYERESGSDAADHVNSLHFRIGLAF